MNILMMTNTYLPHIGGVARSVEAFSLYYRNQGHRVLIIAPEFPQMPEHEDDVIRIAAIQRFNGSDFSVVLPVPHLLGEEIDAFEPDIVHSHHPFLIGSTARLVAKKYNIPLVFTHHTMYEQYSHYVPGDAETLQRFAVKLATSYANMCDQVFAPSESIAHILEQRKVVVPIEVIATGVNLNEFTHGSGCGFREIMGIPNDAFVVGHLGRLAPEKNLEYLCDAVQIFIQKQPRAHFLLVGKGSSKNQLVQSFAKAGLSHRLHTVGFLEQPFLSSAYQAMDVFVFSSQSETQGMVLTEAMAVSLPVIALDAPGVREVVEDNHNGRLLSAQAGKDEFANALLNYFAMSDAQKQTFRYAARATAESYSLDLCATKALKKYTELLGKGYIHRHRDHQIWTDIMNLIEAEYDILKGITKAAVHAVTHQNYDKNP
ncbi:MAG: 1,2-diacylglycerol 3-alpha-glucosyltransferase [Paraglaciecola sp.]|jgi:1,2-diacylglycerol 3-alpha-glucosyltransferase